MARNKLFVKFRRPVRVNEELTALLKQRLWKYDARVPGLWKIFVTDTKRGRASYKSETITVPVWAMAQNSEGESIHRGDEEYMVYYACHEIAHAITGRTPGAPHGPEFMKNFKKVCPKHLWHYELGYKPRNAAAAGIRKPSND